MISIVVPAHREPPFFSELIESIRVQTTSEWELIVVGEPEDIRGKSLVENVGGIWLARSVPRTVKRNLGAAEARGKGLLFVDTDMELARTLISDCENQLTHFDAVCIEETTPKGTYWSQARELERRGCFGSTYFEAARALRSDVFGQIGGYDTLLVGLEDMDLQARLIHDGFRIGWLPNGLTHHDEGLGFRSYLAKKTGRSPKEFARKNPEYWRLLRSPVSRARLVLRGLSRGQKSSDVMLVPGLAIIRAVEYFARWS